MFAPSEEFKSFMKLVNYHYSNNLNNLFLLYNQNC